MSSASSSRPRAVRRDRRADRHAASAALISRLGCMSLRHSALSTRSQSASLSSTSAQSITVWTADVQGSRSLTAISPERRSARRTRASVMRLPLPSRGIVTCGSSGALTSPCTAAAVRWEATVPAGPDRQAIIARRCQMSRVPVRTYTSRAVRRHRLVRTRYLI